MATRIIVWKSKTDNEMEIMKWVYNYSRHYILRYFRNNEGKIIVSEEN